jgi:hypothetical protein
VLVDLKKDVKDKVCSRETWNPQLADMEMRCMKNRLEIRRTNDKEEQLRTAKSTSITPIEVLVHCLLKCTITTCVS